MPLLEIKPNRLASGVTINLFELEGDLRYLMLFVLALVPMVVAFQQERSRRGWTLVVIGNLLIFLTLLLPANAASDLLDGASTMFEEGTRISNPRIFTSTAIALGMLGGYMVMFGGLRDLVAEKAGAWQRLVASTVGGALIVLALVNGSFDIYSIMVEFSQRGDALEQRFVEHLVFVLVSLAAGLVIGIALGLWAARDARMEDGILYSVGIIQTIPSLALFGLLLVPLARLGDQAFTEVFRFFVFSLVVGAVIVFVISRVQNTLPTRLKPWSIVVSLLILFVPLSLFTIMFITFGFEVVLEVFLDSDLSQTLYLIIFALAAFVVMMWIDRKLDERHPIRWLRFGRYVVLTLAALGFVFVAFRGAEQVIGSNTLEELTIRDLGVSGIGTAPAIIALTLYSLLPLVRNTYAGLRNVDPAIIDSGRGMGMTEWQIFFQIELPLAFPIIMAGVRNAGISLVGIAAVASIIGAGALGDFILLGVNTTSVDLILLGAIPAIILAVMLDAFLQLLQDVFTSPGLQQER